MADVAIFAAMQIRDWRKLTDRTMAECAEALGLAGGGRSYHRIETGETNTDSDMVERIVALTAGAVSAADMHETRLAWLKANRPEKFAPSALPTRGEIGAIQP